jgi:serine/threonine protein kinase
MIEAGKVLQKRYRIEKQIGEGGMGAVYIATDERFGSTVAIKETFYSEADFGKAFKREARLLNNLRHAALPRVSDHFEDENGQFLVMEYIAGEDLSEMLAKQNSAFPIKDVMNWADQLLDALDYLHTQDVPVIHRDIKPQNLKLTSRGQIILLDFGLAKGNPTDAQHQTAAKSIFGYSRIYASLEQIQGTGTDPRSDLYSLSATIYHLLTGLPPADALTRAMAVLNNNPDNLKPAHQLNKQIPETVSDVLMRAMSLNANHRPSSASAMRALLRESFQNQKFDANKTIADAPNPTELFSQNTEVLANAIPKPTEAKTDVLETPISVPNKIETEQETSVKTRVEAVLPPIQVDVQQNEKSFAVAQTATNSKGKGGLFAGVALGGLLLVGGGLSAVYVAKPEFLGKSSPANNSNVIQNSNVNSTNLSVSNENSLPMASGENISTTNGNLENKTSVSSKKEATVLNSSKSASDATQKTEVQQNPNVSESNKTKETTVSQPDKKTEVVEIPDVKPTPDVRPSLTPPPLPTPARKIPTAEEFRNMTPAQRQRLKRAYENLPKEEQEKIRQEVENRKQNQPTVTPNRRPPLNPPYPPRP